MQRPIFKLGLRGTDGAIARIPPVLAWSEGGAQLPLNARGLFRLPTLPPFDILFLVDQHFIAPIQIRERHPRLHRTSAASGDFLFIQWPPTYFPLEPSRAWGGASTPKPGPLRDRLDSNPDWL